ncbi:long-chain-fatty-acid--CoA ligase [Phenylobacterium sp.]|uniref:long-chain-fatty-acid--CoA ligase n=1 Tax=Phenylobacterium sp. TaxID=1871053 RepID=UPI00356A74D3
MQDWPLTVDRILEHAKALHGRQEVVTRSLEGPIVRTSYAEIYRRAKRCSNLLQHLGVRPGDRVATLAWNTGRHLETWYGIMGIGAICHTLNPRTFADQQRYIITHAEDKVILVDLPLLPALLALRAHLPSVTHIVVLGDPGSVPEGPGLHAYESLLAQASEDVAWGGFDENAPAGLCYTSGTTGNPKGVLYSHRSNFLHTFMTLAQDVMGLSARAVVLPIVPMFHANAWGLTFSCPAAGAKMVMPGQRLDGAALQELIETEGVTFAAAVPTVWQGLLDHLRATGAQIGSLRRIMIGGAAAPEALLRAYRDDYGVEVTHAWGMTEVSPVGTVSTATDEIAALDADAQLRFNLKQGRAPLGVELKLKDEAGQALPEDGVQFGRLMVRGPAVARRYFKDEGGEILDEDGYFDTGDMATIDPHGFMQITDRAKDVIKSGGEWISSIEIENIVAGHPKVELCAVVAIPHPKWDERPVLLVKLRADQAATRDDFLDYLQGRIARWWMPDDVVFLSEIPLGPTGKVDKKRLRADLRGFTAPPT